MPEDLNSSNLEEFHKASQESIIVNESMGAFEPIIKEWASFIHQQSVKGLVPLFVTGSGISSPEVPNIWELIDKLSEIFNDSKPSFTNAKNVKSLLDTFANHAKKDRGIVGRILNTFQQEKAFDTVWQDFNKWLLKDKVLAAKPSESHTILAKLYEDANAICLTLNFDGLLIRKLRENGKSAFSIPDEKECERFFLRTGPQKEFIEIQARGDILYLKCSKGSGTGRGYCPEGDKPPRPLWLFLPPDLYQDIDKLYNFASRCPSCDGPRVSYLAFPGSYEKEKDMQNILTIVWRYLALRVGCLTVIGLSGTWDPLIVAFIGDLLKERNIPLLIVDIDPEKAYIVNELVSPIPVNAVALKCPHNKFTQLLHQYFKENVNSLRAETPPSEIQSLGPFNIETSTDRYWDNPIIIRDLSLRNQINKPISSFEEGIFKEIRDQYHLDKYAQLGLKAKWLGIRSGENKNHNRLFHSLGVMKISSFLYDNIKDNHGFKRENEQRFLRIAALLHDIGHLPFAHLIEEIFQELNWKPAKYEEFFTHSLNTVTNINDMFTRNPSFQDYMISLGYTTDDLIRLINGEFGVGYLDAIINSPIDADKMDYIFRDTSATDKRIILSPEQFLRDIVLEMSLTPERFLAISGASAKCGVELLETRRFLYKNLYLRPGIRFLERALKFIIVTYFVHWVKLEREKIREISDSCSDLGHYKILSCINSLKYLVKEVATSGTDKEIEIEIVRKMENFLVNSRLLSDRIKGAIQYAFKQINETTSEDTLKALEAKIIYFLSGGPREMSSTEKDKYIEAAKSCILRLPGSVLIDIIESPKFLSVADARKKRERSDGTDTYSECIIAPSGDYRTWYPKQTANCSLVDCLSKEEERKVIVHLYPVTEDESYVLQARNLYTKLLEEKGVKEVD